ncbi:hypothetical protein BAUCODRAFT_22939 [Baudoinia panamericana UAMH 10762]|uniref:Carboxylic ester hydrolase n=1 Tax=Baudoinia panamericana (strain UAMH 10762) TaxID=717646 RepID=M2NFR9_BAUPA|nr:uncharacterized protein BAUCODRAFT_22939 [Baudoinia panamericana UAMH 10762]EMC98104.1 hypothetical protein BAUCODRAFT_22939 [Baudoinia panamericana UAMH 10762]
MFAFLLLIFAGAAIAATTAPTVTVKNGTLRGIYSSQWEQDFFLGIPYAQPPLGPLRFKWPQPLNTTYNGTRDTTSYGYSCYQYGSNFNLSEDCLTLNGTLILSVAVIKAALKQILVVRPSGHQDQALPILLWIFGGGLTAGSSADPQYNISGIVKTASDSGQPLIGTPLLLNEGSLNARLLDQRMAMQYVLENIAAFGGDPARVTIWGESAGAQSIGLHLHSFGGRNDGLYSAAIMESGGPVGTSLNPLPFYSVAFENLTRTVGCWTSSNQLGCLRNLTSQQLFNSNYTVVWNPSVDGTFLTAYPSTLAANGSFVRVPILTGANSDEGISFSTHGLDNSTAIFDNLLYWCNYALSPPSITTLLNLYPNNPSIEPPYRDRTNTTYPGYGLQWRRDAAIGGDLVIIGQRRKTCGEFVIGGINDVYSYRFDTPLWNATAPVSVYHFVNVVFSFQNISGALGPLPEYESYKHLATCIGRAYASFVSSHQPNGAVVEGEYTNGNVTGLPLWPKYDLSAPKNMVLNANGSYVEDDTWRREGIAFNNSISRELLA